MPRARASPGPSLRWSDDDRGQWPQKPYRPPNGRWLLPPIDPAKGNQSFLRLELISEHAPAGQVQEPLVPVAALGPDVEDSQRPAGVDGDHPQGGGQHGGMFAVQAEGVLKVAIQPDEAVGPGQRSLAGRRPRRVTIAGAVAKQSQHLSQAEDDAGLAGAVTLQ
jgi:hypothetical protein